MSLTRLKQRSFVIDLETDLMRRRMAKSSEHAAIAVRDEVVRVTLGRPNVWASVHEIAQRLGLDDEIVDAAVHRSIDQGWLIGDGYPPRSVRLAITSLQELS